MKGAKETALAMAMAGAMVAMGAQASEAAHAAGIYRVVSTGPVEAFRAEYVALRDLISTGLASDADHARFAEIPLEEKWSDDIHNAVTTEGKNSALTQFFKGSAYTATAFLGLIESTGYGFAGATGSGVAATNIAANITGVGGGSPANGWNEATTSQCAARGTPSFGTASAGALALSASTTFAMLATCTIKGCFMMCRSVAGVAAVATTASIAGMIYSAGLFTGGDKACNNGDTLSVSYTASL
jgi:hypothetical protein